MQISPRLLGTLFIAAGLVSGCIQGTPNDNTGAEEVIASNVSTKAPEVEHRLGTVFGGKVELIGYDLEPDEISPGDVVRVTWHWHCLEELGDGWSQFTHLVDAQNGQMVSGGNYDEATVGGFRRAYPAHRWKAGQYIRDQQRVTIPEKISASRAEFRIGFFQGRERLEISKGVSDSRSRARGPAFDTGYEPPPIGELTVPFISGELTIDGRLDEPMWRQAAKTKAFVQATDGEPGLPQTKARLMYDTQHLYLGFDCDDDHLFSTFTQRDDHLWKQDAVEVFIDPTGSGRDYLEFQVNPKGLIFDTKVHRHPRRDDEYDGLAKTATTRRGSMNDDDDRDEGWTVELMIPFTGLGQDPPEPGAMWRLNLFRLDTRLNNRRAFLSWSPPLANTTHITRRFGKITFGPRLAETQSATVEGEAGTAGDNLPDATPAEAR